MNYCLLDPFVVVLIASQLVSQQYGKNFNFYKQHAISHVIEDIREKGATPNFSTRMGEGFQQEVAEAYNQTNKRNPDHQVRTRSSEVMSQHLKHLS